MARPNKQGLDYFPLDVGFLRDIKVRRIKKAQKNAVEVLIALLSNIYQDEGYFMSFDDDVCFLIADDVGVSEGAVTSVIDMALKVDFFDKVLYEKYKILTSRGIQKRFIEATNRRQQVNMCQDYLLINTDAVNHVVVNVDNNDISDELMYTETQLNGINVDNNRVNVYRSTQSKVKESKVKYIDDDYINIFISACKKLLNRDFILQSSTPAKLKYLVKNYEKAVFEQVLSNIKDSQYLTDNADIDFILNNFIKIYNGKYKDFKTNKSSNSFNNSVNVSNSFSDEELEDLAREKRDKLFKEMGDGI
ncbi:Hypothetical protein ING2D1G_0689 [Peptoniphilus sp. ING2-D1G]|nr:Hypothetical protein ING2D1G_0689 [Peptoniphilus sp. ING2-D1G]